ncbi:MAG TPA: hypothetical protein VGK38_06665 [Prolixibacteraceae bacterium]|jgi:hypothetical protein
MKAIERLYQYFEFKGIRPSRFEKDIGIGNGYFSLQHRRGADIGSSIVEKIAEYARDLNIEWLMIGLGSMTKVIDQDSTGESTIDRPQTNDIGPPGCESCKNKDEIIAVLRQQVDLQSEFIIHLKGSKIPGETKI